jgi:hypothetical protein
LLAQAEEGGSGLKGVSQDEVGAAEGDAVAQGGPEGAGLQRAAGLQGVARSRRRPGEDELVGGAGACHAGRGGGSADRHDADIVQPEVGRVLAEPLLVWGAAAAPRPQPPVQFGRGGEGRTRE